MSRVATLQPAPAPAELHHLAFAEAFARAHADDRRHWATRGRWMTWSAGEGWREATEPLHDMARAIDRIVPTDERDTWYRVNHLRDSLALSAESLRRDEWDQGDTLLGLPGGRVVELTTGKDRAQTPDDWMGRPQSSWTRIKGESDVTRRWGYGSVEAGEGSWVGADGGSPEGDRSRRRRGGDGVGGLGAGTTVEREPETGCGVAAAA